MINNYCYNIKQIDFLTLCLRISEAMIDFLFKKNTLIRISFRDKVELNMNNENGNDFDENFEDSNLDNDEEFDKENDDDEIGIFNDPEDDEKEVNHYDEEHDDGFEKEYDKNFERNFYEEEYDNHYRDDIDEYEEEFFDIVDEENLNNGDYYDDFDE